MNNYHGVWHDEPPDFDCQEPLFNFLILPQFFKNIGVREFYEDDYFGFMKKVGVFLPNRMKIENFSEFGPEGQGLFKIKKIGLPVIPFMIISPFCLDFFLEVNEIKGWIQNLLNEPNPELKTSNLEKAADLVKSGIFPPRMKQELSLDYRGNFKASPHRKPVLSIQGPPFPDENLKGFHHLAATLVTDEPGFFSQILGSWAAGLSLPFTTFPLVVRRIYPVELTGNLTISKGKPHYIKGFYGQDPGFMARFPDLLEEYHFDPDLNTWKLIKLGSAFNRCDFDYEGKKSWLRPLKSSLSKKGVFSPEFFIFLDQVLSKTTFGPEDNFQLIFQGNREELFFFGMVN